MIDKVREEIADTIIQNYVDCESLALADKILSIKLGNITLKELIELYDKGKLVKMADEQSLPKVPYIPNGIDKVYERAQADMLKAGFKKVEPL